MYSFFRNYGPAILWALFIFIICTVKLGGVSSSPLFFPCFDKLVHCGLFFVLVILCCNGFIRQLSTGVLPYKSIILITLAAIIYGGLIELLQNYFFTWRSGDWNDLFADTIGASMGAFGQLSPLRQCIMKKNKLIIIALLGTIVFSSCGIFHGGCHCPKFGKVQMYKYANVLMC